MAGFETKGIKTKTALTGESRKKNMSSGLRTKRDFQISETMQWHGETKLKKPESADFPLIERRPLYFFSGEERRQVVFATRNDDEPKTWTVPVSLDDDLPVACPSCDQTYSLWTPLAGWEYVGACLASTGFEIESIGMLWDRSVWFISTRLKELTALAPKGHKAFLNFSCGLGKDLSPQGEVSDTREVCWNTVIQSRINGEVLFKVKATKNFFLKAEDKKKEIEKAVGFTAVYYTALAQCESKPCKENEAREAFYGFSYRKQEELPEKVSTRARNFVGELVTLFAKGLGNKGETRADALNAITEARTRGFEDSIKSKFDQFQSSEFGGFADEKAEFARLAFDDDAWQQTVKRGRAIAQLV